MWCPYCKAKYREGFSQCADCGVALVNEKPVEKSPGKPIEYEKPVVVFTSSNLHEAHLIQSLLKGSGIEARAVDSHVSSIEPFYVNAVGGIKIVVDEKQLKKAQSILKEYRSKESESPTVGESSPFGSSSDDPEVKKDVARSRSEVKYMLMAFLFVLIVGSIGLKYRNSRTYSMKVLIQGSLGDSAKQKIGSEVIEKLMKSGFNWKVAGQFHKLDYRKWGDMNLYVSRAYEQNDDPFQNVWITLTLPYQDKFFPEQEVFNYCKKIIEEEVQIMVRKKVDEGKIPELESALALPKSH